MGNVSECSRRIISLFRLPSPLIKTRKICLSSHGIGVFTSSSALPLLFDSVFVTILATKYCHIASLPFSLRLCFFQRHKKTSWSLTLAVVQLDRPNRWQCSRTSLVIHFNILGLISANSQCMHKHTYDTPSTYTPRHGWDSYYYYYH